MQCEVQKLSSIDAQPRNPKENAWFQNSAAFVQDVA